MRFAKHVTEGVQTEQGLHHNSGVLESMFDTMDEGSACSAPISIWRR